MHRRSFALSALAVALAAGAAPALAQAPTSGPFKIGFILPMTGQSASTGKQIEAAAKLYMAQNGIDGRRPQGRADHQGRRRRRRHDAPARAGAGRQREGRRARRLRPDAARAGDRADRDAEQDADGRHRGGDVDHHRAVAVHRAHQLHAAAGHGRRSPSGRPRTRSRKSSPSSPTTARGSMPRSSSRASSSSTAARSSARSARRCAAPTSRRSCRRSPTSSPTPCSCSCRPGRARPS